MSLYVTSLFFWVPLTSVSNRRSSAITYLRNFKFFLVEASLCPLSPLFLRPLILISILSLRSLPTSSEIDIILFHPCHVHVPTPSGPPASLPRHRPSVPFL